MPFQGSLTAGDRYSITVDSDPVTPGTTAFAIVWVPKVGGTASTPVIDSIAPGARALHAGVVPAGQMLLLDFDLPDDPRSKITINVSANATVVVSGSESGDTEWTWPADTCAPGVSVIEGWLGFIPGSAAACAIAVRASCRIFVVTATARVAQWVPSALARWRASTAALHRVSLAASGGAVPTRWS